MLLVGLQCHWLISLYRDLQKYPCFCSFEWCSLRFFCFFFCFCFLKLQLPCFLRLPWTNSFQGDQSCALYTPTFGFSYPLEAFSLCTPHWALLTICTFAGMCYGLYLLLVRVTACTHYWYMLRVVTITDVRYKLYLLLGYAYNLHLLLEYVMACIHCWNVLQVVPIAGTCYRLYPLLVRATGYTYY